MAVYGKASREKGPFGTMHSIVAAELLMSLR